MKAIVTVIDNDGRVIEKDKVIMPYDEIIDLPKDCVATKTTYFRFGITECICDKHIIGKEKDNGNTDIDT